MYKPEQLSQQKRRIPRIFSRLGIVSHIHDLEEIECRYKSTQSK